MNRRSSISRIAVFFKENAVISFFLVFALVMMYFSKTPLNAIGSDVSSRFFRNILLITALILPIMSGVGLNFGITLGAMGAQLALVLIMILGIDDKPLSIVYWFLLTIIISAICGRLLAVLFNKTKGHEMIAGLLVGFFANGIYEFILMVLCGDILKIDVKGLVLSKGLPIKATIDLSNTLSGYMDNSFPVAYYYIAYIAAISAVVYFIVKMVKTLVKSNKEEEKRSQVIKSVAGIVIVVAVMVFCLNNAAIRKMFVTVDFPLVTAAFSVVVIFAVSRIMRSKVGHDFISVRNDRYIAASVGIDVDKSRTKSIVLSTVIAGLGQMLYIQNLGTLNTYVMHNSVAIYAIAAILIGGATVKSANVRNVLVGNLLFQIIYGCAPNAAKILMGNTQIGEYFRVFLCYAIIAVAIVSNAMQDTAAAKKRSRGT